MMIHMTIVYTVEPRQRGHSLSFMTLSPICSKDTSLLLYIQLCVYMFTVQKD